MLTGKEILLAMAVIIGIGAGDMVMAQGSDATAGGGSAPAAGSSSGQASTGAKPKLKHRLGKHFGKHLGKLRSRMHRHKGGAAQTGAGSTAPASGSPAQQ